MNAFEEEDDAPEGAEYLGEIQPVGGWNDFEYVWDMVEALPDLTDEERDYFLEIGLKMPDERTDTERNQLYDAFLSGTALAAYAGEIDQHPSFKKLLVDFFNEQLCERRDQKNMEWIAELIHCRIRELFPELGI